MTLNRYAICNICSIDNIQEQEDMLENSSEEVFKVHEVQDKLSSHFNRMNKLPYIRMILFSCANMLWFTDLFE